MLSVLALWSDTKQVLFVRRVLSGVRVTTAEAKAVDAAVPLINLMSYPLFIATGILFLMWIYRAHRNLPALGAGGLGHTPGWAVGSWFVPFICLYRPFQVMREIWKASDPASPIEDQNAWPMMESTARLGWWWACWLLRLIVLRWGQTMGKSAVKPADFLRPLYWNLAGHIISLAGLVLLITLILEIDRRQTERHDLVFRWEAERLMPHS